MVYSPKCVEIGISLATSQATPLTDKAVEPRGRALGEIGGFDDESSPTMGNLTGGGGGGGGTH